MMARDHRFVAFFIAVVMVVGYACGSSPSAPTTSGPFVISGLVLDFQTSAVVPAATVSFGDLLSPAVLPADPRSVTGGSGAYQLSLMPGRYHVWVDGAYRGEAWVRNGVNHTDLLVHDGGCATRYGTIADAGTGRPIAGAAVSLLGVNATTGADGTYRLDFGCRGYFAFTGTIGMSVSRVGYQTGSVPMGRGENFVNALRQDLDLVPQ
jgi:hypothetical protein